MPPPAPGAVRVLVHANVGNLRAGRWHDVPDSVQLHDWEQMRLVSRTGPGGAPPPVDLPPLPCCGQA